MAISIPRKEDFFTVKFMGGEVKVYCERDNAAEYASSKASDYLFFVTVAEAEEAKNHQELSHLIEESNRKIIKLINTRITDVVGFEEESTGKPIKYDRSQGADWFMNLLPDEDAFTLMSLISAEYRKQATAAANKLEGKSQPTSE